MYRNFNNYQQYNDQRFIGPVLPFIGGALVGYIAGRPNGGYYQPYYPVYYQYPPYQYQYYQVPTTYTN